MLFVSAWSAHLTDPSLTYNVTHKQLISAQLYGRVQWMKEHSRPKLWSTSAGTDIYTRAVSINFWNVSFGHDTLRRRLRHSSLTASELIVIIATASLPLRPGSGSAGITSPLCMSMG